MVHKGKEKNDLMLSRKVPNGNCFGRTTEAQSALKGIGRAPEGAFQEPLAPLIAHWSERIIFINATLPGVELEIVMNEMRKLMKHLQIHPMIFVGVQECKLLLYIGGM